MPNTSMESMVGEILGLLKGGKAQPIPIARFSAEVAKSYLPKARATRLKMAQVLREVAALPDVTTTADLTRPTIALWVAQQQDAGRHPNTIRGLLSYLRAACNLAEEEGWLSRVPFNRRHQYIRGEATSKRHHPVGDIARVLDHLAGRSAGSWQDHRLYALFSVYAFTGMRKMEALFLHSEDVDLTARCLMVNPRRRRPKTEASAAPVPVPKALAKILKGWLPECGSDWVFPTVDRSKPWTGGVQGTKPLDRIKAAGQACGVQGLTIASLRHTWATAAENLWGLSEPQIQRVLRHTTTKTQQHYRHADILVMADAVKGLKFTPAPQKRKRHRA